MADALVKRAQYLLSDEDLLSIHKRTSDEVFLDGGMAHFKKIPIIAELPPGEELIVE